MTSPAITLPADAGPRPVVRFDRLLALYAIVPFSVAAVVIDQVALHGRLRELLPRHPDQLLFFTLLFNFPHVLASHLILLDREYLGRYWKHVVGAMLVLVPLTFGLLSFGIDVVFVFAMLITVYHIISQQVGLTGAQLRVRDWSFLAWRVLTLVAGTAQLLTVVENIPMVVAARPALTVIAIVSLVPSTAIAARLSTLATSSGGRRYLWANQSMFVVMGAMLLAGYPLVTWLLARVVHDLSAFYVYGVHDTNRNQGGHAPNVLYRALAPLGISPRIAGPALAIGGAYLVDRVLPKGLALHIVYWLSGLHYYLEGVVWKSGTLHRRYAAFR